MTTKLEEAQAAVIQEAREMLAGMKQSPDWYLWTAADGPWHWVRGLMTAVTYLEMAEDDYVQRKEVKE